MLRNLFTRHVRSTEFNPTPDLQNPAFLEAKSGSQIEDRVACSRINFDSRSILPPMLPGEEVLNDTNHLRALQRHALNLEIADFQRVSRTLIEILLDRVSEFNQNDFTLKRFQGWCASVSSWAGTFHYGNRHFLYKVGSIVDDVFLLQRIAEAIHVGILESDRRLGISFPDMESWINHGENDLKASRLRLATATSYLVREANEIDQQMTISKSLPSWLPPAYDIRVLSPGFAGIKFSRSDDAFLNEVKGTVRDAIEYFSTDGDFQRRPKVPHRVDPMARTAFLACLRAAGNLDLLDDVVRLFESLNLGPADVVADDLIPHRLEITRRMRPNRSVAGMPNSPFSDSNPSKSPTKRMQICEMKLKEGLSSEARKYFPTETEIGRFGLADMHTVMALAPRLFHGSKLAEIIRHCHLRMRSLATAHLGNVNFLARAIQYDALVNDHFSLDQANLALKRLSFTQTNELHKEVVLLYFDQDRVLPTLLAPIIPEMARKGVNFFSLQEGGLSEIIPLWPYGPHLTANSDGVVGQQDQFGELLNCWEINLEQRTLSTDGINYYQGMYERVGRVLKVFHVDWNLPSSQLYFRLWLSQIDRLIFCLNSVVEVARRDRLRVRLVSLQGHFVPYFALKMFAEKHSDCINHITVSSSYENWATNMTGDVLSTLTMQNNTVHRAPSAPAFGTANDFESWYNNTFLPNEEMFTLMNDRLTNVRRAGDSNSELMALIEHASRGEGQLFCALGKIPYDLTVPSQGGPAHTDMGDWIRHTVETVDRSEKNLLLVKPHPHELNVGISGKPSEGFVDLLPRIDTDRIIVLPHRGVSLQDLRGLVDTFICWNGSSITEVGSWGERILACDYWASRNYPVGVTQPEDREHYEAFLRGECEIEMSADFRKRAIAYNCYLTVAPFAADYPFVNRSANNVNFNEGVLNFSRLNDPHLKKCAEWAYQMMFDSETGVRDAPKL